MPRIRRWHPVSHDFVRDREVQELRRRFGHWMSDVWLEILAEADKNEGRVKGDYDSISRSLAWISLSNRPETQVKHVRNALYYMAEHGWIKPGTGCVLVSNYAEYHKTREKKESREGEDQAPPFLPSEPSEQTRQVLNTNPKESSRSRGEPKTRTGRGGGLRPIADAFSQNDHQKEGPVTRDEKISALATFLAQDAPERWREMLRSVPEDRYPADIIEAGKARALALREGVSQ